MVKDSEIEHGIEIFIMKWKVVHVGGGQMKAPTKFTGKLALGTLNLPRVEIYSVNPLCAKLLQENLHSDAPAATYFQDASVIESPAQLAQ